MTGALYVQNDIATHDILVSHRCPVQPFRQKQRNPFDTTHVPLLKQIELAHSSKS